ncbi:hypothetical protein GO755_07495 [Spirosoma sp. HMF4905]|uniref:Outer membrane beta-barrel protein n=1 Tax=Spirosoma arboris TaxID=2682092 RepID=A0A7K1S7R4_9BACT|nr:hypothetical protein [Spirosoma arboris]MVM29871.1 hypothetical protein [Spirosoma arboris]
MDELDKNIPDDFWRKTFDEAAETPPSRVWNSIERRLDQSNDTKIIPLWGLGLISSRPFAWGMGVAAAVTLLLIGWWAGSTQTAYEQHQSVAQHTESADRINVKSQAPVNATVDKSLVQSPTTIASANKTSLPSAKSKPTSEYPVAISSSVDDQASGLLDQLKVVTNQKANTTDNSIMTISADHSTMAPVATNVPLPSSSASRTTISSFAFAHSVSSKIVASKLNELAAFEPLLGKSWRFRDLGQIHRIVWFRPTELPLKPESLKSKQKTHDVWASASVMPGAFNPMVSVQSAAVYTNSYASMDALKASQASSSVSSRANFSVAYQAGAGVQLTEHWSLESGVGYLSGRSTVETPAQLPTASLVAISGKNTTSGTLYVDALKSSIHTGDMAASPASYNNVANSVYQQANYANSTRQVLTNDYQYMQVPLQVGYQLRPRKRLSLAVLGGLITNIFIRNTVGNEVTVTAKDGVYRPLSLAATMGARLRYRPTPQWSASLAGAYQPSLGLGTQSDSQVQTHPTSTGMSFGVDYHF